MSLQLPYIIFGLGSTPNFVEQLTVGILITAKTDQSQYTKVWRQQIIPNSQLVINPSPREYSYL
jgi:integrin alpha FG-GAP repeat containing protein 1